LLGQQFGMPLYPQVEGVALELHRFYKAIWSSSHHTQARGQAFEGLMVIRVNPKALREELIQGALLGLLDTVAQRGRLRFLAMLHGTKPLGRKILVKAAPQGYVHHLNTTANPQGGNAVLSGITGYKQLDRIALEAHLPQLGNGLLGKMGRIHIHSSRKQHPVQLAQQGR